ncbi:MAG: hypothetical protein DWQ09_05935 [Proteobacteria bacterium]|nr:MAG: hypothetical protein DWQ09_05935 [Pseudomonadota bacterium]QKK10222.1 MAG: hypothetical protein HND59_07635 [Pseudomonadota bacterium]
MPHRNRQFAAGLSGCGKPTLTASVDGRLIEKDYQVCVIDPEGDYGTLRDIVTLGNQWCASSVGVSDVTKNSSPRDKGSA